MGDMIWETKICNMRESILYNKSSKSIKCNCKTIFRCVYRYYILYSQHPA